MIRALFLLSFLTQTVFASSYISAYDPIYENLDRMEAYNCAYPTLRVLGPQTHQELISTVYVAPEQDRCEAPEWLLKERQILTRPLYPARMENRSVVMADDFVTLAGTSATLSPLIPYREGRPLVSGFSSATELNAQSATNARMIGVAGGLRPGWVGMIPQQGPLQGKFYLQEGYLKFSYGWSSLVWGRTALRFGNTLHGSLLFSEATQPTDLWKYSLRPALPMRYLGPIHLDFFLGSQSDSGPARGAHLLGVQLALRPVHWLEFGWMELFKYGGVGVPALGLGEVLSMALYLNNPQLQASRSRTMATHLGFWLFKHRVKLYGQALFSDFHQSGDLSYLAGLWFPRIGSHQLRFEWVETGTSAFPQYETTPLGHPLGPSGQGLYIDSEWAFFTDYRIRLGFRREVRGRKLALASGLAPETRWGPELRIKRRWWDMELEAGGVFHKVTNPAYQDQTSLQSVGVFTNLVYSFL